MNWLVVLLFSLLFSLELLRSLVGFSFLYPSCLVVDNQFEMEMQIRKYAMLNQIYKTPVLGTQCRREEASKAGEEENNNRKINRDGIIGSKRK